MTNIQLCFAIGIPTFTILCSLVIGVFQLNHAVNRINMRLSTLGSRLSSVDDRAGSIESRLDARMAVIESDLKIVVRSMGDMHTRIARLEERGTS